MKEKRQRAPDRSSREAPESDFFLITRNRRQREEGGGQSQPEEPGGGQTTRRDSGEVPEKGAPEQAETEEGEAQKEAPERSRSRLGLVF